MESQKLKQFCHQVKACNSLHEAKQLATVYLNKELGPKPIGIAQPIRRRDPSLASPYTSSERRGPAGTISGSESDSDEGYTIEVHFGDTPPPTRRQRLG